MHSVVIDRSACQVGESLSTGADLSSVYAAVEAKVEKSVSIMGMSDGADTNAKTETDSHRILRRRVEIWLPYSARLQVDSHSSHSPLQVYRLSNLYPGKDFRHEGGHMLNRQAVEEVIVLLAEEFKIPRPRIRWHGRTLRGRACWTTNTIYLGPNCWRGMDSVLHEFAHILHYRTTGERGCHREGFVYALKKTAHAWYGDHTKYSWQTEYRSLRKYGS
jgi:hypothetical protein